MAEGITVACTRCTFKALEVECMAPTAFGDTQINVLQESSGANGVVNAEAVKYIPSE